MPTPDDPNERALRALPSRGLPPGALHRITTAMSDATCPASARTPRMLHLPLGMAIAASLLLCVGSGLVGSALMARWDAGAESSAAPGALTMADATTLHVEIPRREDARTSIARWNRIEVRSGDRR